MQAITVTALTTATPAQARACFTDPAAITRWNFAAEAWSCPEAESDLRVGGAFRYRMAARDGSVAFDYSGTWAEVEDTRLVQVLEDGRRVEITFEPAESGARVTQVFDPDPSAPREMQEAGWQAILHRFAAFAGEQPRVSLETLAARDFVGVRRQVPVTELGAFFAEAFPKVMGWLGAKGVAPASPPAAMWLNMDMETGIADCHAGCFVHAPVEGEGDISPGQTPAGEALVVTHTGSYDGVGRTWMAAYKRAGELGRAPGAGWEVYIDDPGSTPTERLRTKIHLPLR